MQRAPWIVVLSLFGVIVLAGCISGPESDESELDASSAEYELHIKTEFVSGNEEREARVPEGTPAAFARLTIGPREHIQEMGEGEPPDSWEYHEWCPWRSTGHGGGWECSDHPARERIVLPPVGTETPRSNDGLAYPLTATGELILASHEPFEAMFTIRGPYSPQMMDQRIHPDEDCEPLIWTPKNDAASDVSGVTVRQSSAGNVIIEVSQSGKVTLGWDGFCRDDEGHG